MKKEEYNLVFKHLLSYFKKNTDIVDALKFVDDAVKNHQDQIFAPQTKSSAKAKAPNTFSLPKNLHKKANTFIIYTDGACRGNPGPGAYGTLIQDSSEKIVATLSGIEFQTTNNQMELTGAIKGFSELVNYLESKSKKMEIHLFSDSKYLVDGMNQWVEGWKKRNWKKADNKSPDNLSLWQELDELKTRFKLVHFNWVKGHAGHPQNEYCDQLANQALDDAGC